MTMITIDRTVEDETTEGIEFTRVYFSVDGQATAEEIDTVLASEMADLTNFRFDHRIRKGVCVTIDFAPKIGSSYEIATT
ncbi:hypothetical protein [Janthinobacterium sp. NKUCC06_STL]|jgi:hypothetical protein|uniref:hypothetical protein n=1 Tax=Janthinobacterium sp. NKUCC06_STL TaxID=2842127 RepID=UPI001C5AD7A0|nr:hypothetical protein [Janthinobacterium sp. NKUCC06_STL]MBW3512075.1 hypothetical protein [Janthinobacterium sp. NKUCC06_STL]